MADTQLHPLPLVAGFMFSAQRLENPYVYRYHEDRWYLTSNGLEWMLIETSDGLLLVDNPY